MGCFPACFGHLRRDLTTKKVQHQCMSPSNEQHESVKLLPEPQFQDVSNEEETASHHSNVKKGSDDDKLVEDENGKVEKEKEREELTNPLHQDLLMNERECLAKETSSSAVQEESCCSSLFTLDIHSRKQFFAAEMGEKEVSSPLKINHNTSSEHVVEQKETTKDEPESVSDRQCRGRKDSEMAVETSLSSWLVETEKSLQKMSAGSSPESENNYGDRQILRVVASPADIINKLSGVSSATTPCCSGDDQPGVGTVGRYWQRRDAAREVADGEVSSGGTRGLATVEAS